MNINAVTSFHPTHYWTVWIRRNVSIIRVHGKLSTLNYLFPYLDSVLFAHYKSCLYRPLELLSWYNNRPGMCPGNNWLWCRHSLNLEIVGVSLSWSDLGQLWRSRSWWKSTITLQYFLSVMRCGKKVKFSHTRYRALNWQIDRKTNWKLKDKLRNQFRRSVVIIVSLTTAIIEREISRLVKMQTKFVISLRKNRHYISVEY